MTGLAPRNVEECGLSLSSAGLSVNMRIPAERSYLNNALLTVREICDHLDIAPVLTLRIVLALEEALLNTFEHAYQEVGGVVDVQFAVTSNEFRVIVEDYGQGLLSCQTREISENLESLTADRGRGLIILRGMADEAVVDSANGQGTKATMLFRLLEERA